MMDALFRHMEGDERVTIDPDETVIRGGWEYIEGRMVPDDALRRIQKLVRSHLQRVANGSDGWETLFLDPAEGRLWERSYPQGEMHGGGPESLRSIDRASAEQKYGIKL
jgi:hypothetical protein